MMKRRAVVPIVLSVLLLASCASRPPAREEAAKGAAAPAAKYPPERFITAEGVSDKGFQEAETNATAQVMAQISSTLEAETRVVVGEINRGGKITGSQEVVEVVRARSSYPRGELIRLDPAARRREGKKYYAMACLSRAEAIKAPAEAYETTATTFRQAAKAATRDADDLAAFTASFRQVESNFTALASNVREIRAVTQRTYNPWEQDLTAYHELLARRVEILRGLRLAVDVEGRPADVVRDKIVTALTRALSDLDLAASPGSNEPRGYALRVTPTVRQFRGSFGPQASLTMSCCLVQCASGKVLAEMDLSDPSFKGMHSHDPDRALAALVARVTPDALRPLLAAGLSPVLPIEASGR